MPKEKMISRIISTMNTIRKMCREELLSRTEADQYTAMFYKCSLEKLEEIQTTLSRTGIKTFNSLENTAKAIVKRTNYLREEGDRKKDREKAISSLRF